MYKIENLLDAKQAAAISRRRAAEEERKKRIFNPKQRIIGKDFVALHHQMEEKKAREQEERQLEIAYGRERNRQDLVAIEIDNRRARDRLQLAKDLDVYRKIHQRYEDRREYDINDMDGLKKTLPARLHDEDPRCGPASLQRFEGEDVNTKARDCAQTLQRRAWLEAQIQEKKASEADLKRASELYDLHLQQMDLRTCALTEAEMEARRSVRLATAQYNLAMAYENEEKKCLEKKAHDEAAMAHILNVCNSELLTETQDATSVGGPHRVCRERYKGWGQAQVGVIREEQLRQVMDKKRREKELRQEDEAWDNMKRREDLSGLLLQYDMDRHRRDIRIQTERTNQELAREQVLRQEYLNRILYKDAPTEEFFDQFNTTTR